MQTIHLDGKAYQLPERWSEVDQERLPQLLQLVYFTPPTGEVYHEIIRLALNISGKPWRKLMQTHFGPNVGRRTRQANAIVLHTLKTLLRWLETEPIQEQPFKRLELDMGVDLLLPEAGFLTMSFGELTDAYIHFLVWIRQLVQGDEHLNLLVATLCRPIRTDDYQNDPDWNGDYRERYSEFTTKQRAKLVSLLEPGYKMAVVLYFAGNLQQVLERYRLVEGEDGEPEEYPGQSWIKNQHLLAEKGIFGNIAQTKAANLHDVLLFLEEHQKDVMREMAQKREEAMA
ncbi:MULTISPECIES: hypothetical protein [unclassified Spirosoma]|uniref:hypothetical protein n=1 Tax=unclassified Spirosoma TaxID=2621999 RepID=UPI0009693BD6|nr:MULTISPECIES: hypothetical protein [unclassified Spirosoma]MBN8820766.1 hypothetical protein [Spirosoma sp.]OJW76359.1 MAG: hypothetical protein BGO59_22835 [Spirosoma sp. 48-14]